jgi:hypothetical protein
MRDATNTSPQVRVLLGACACFTAAAFIVKGTEIGPVVVVVNAGRGWGVHIGDGLAIPFAAAGFWLVSQLIFRRTSQPLPGRASLRLSSRRTRST